MLSTPSLEEFTDDHSDVFFQGKVSVEEARKNIWLVDSKVNLQCVISLSMFFFLSSHLKS